MTNNPNPNDTNANAGGQDGNANQGGGNSQGQGGNQAGNQGGQDPNRGAGDGGNQAGGEDFKVKFGESTKENQRLMKLLQEQGIDPKTGKKAEGAGNFNGAGADDQGGGDAGGAPYFTDADLEAAFPSFNTMTAQEKAVLRQVGSFPKMARMVAEMHDKLTFSEQLEVLKANPAHKLIAENEKEFKAFAYQDGNLKIPIDILANAFIGRKLAASGGQQGGDQNGGEERQGMENGSGGQGSGGSAVQEMTAEQARELRQKDPRKYNALARKGMLKIVGGE